MQLPRGNLFLIGMMGCGKSTMGRQLARRLGKSFLDSDAELERRTGVPVSMIFELEGEEGFRDREQALLNDLTQHENTVLATGGGIVLRSINREKLRQNGLVVYLHAPVETLWQRTRHSRHRPLLHTADPRAKLTELYNLRDTLYRDTANFVFEACREPMGKLVRKLQHELTRDPLTPK